jgi:RNA-directed DNA polymerase
MISNIIMESLDREFVTVCKSSSVNYTRYADDITISGENVDALLATEKEISRIIKRTRRPKLIFNEAKRGIYTKAGRRIVTGLVITPDKKISLGRSRKREISAALHYISTGKNTSENHISNTRGWLAYARSVEPQFFQAMVRKYGATVRQVVRAVTPRRYSPTR